MLPNVKVKEVMTTDVVCVAPNDLMNEVGEIFDENSFHHIPVVDQDEQLVGIISRHDYNKMLDTFSIFKKSRAEAANRRYKMSMLVKDVMTSQVAKIHPDDGIMIAMGMFRENLFHAIPVVDEENRVAGILTTFDMLNFAYNENSPVNLSDLKK